VRGRKLEVEHFLDQSGVDICLLSETFLKACQIFRLANCVCHRTDLLIAGEVSHITSNRNDFRHNVFLFTLKLLPETFLILRRNERDMIKKKSSTFKHTA